MNIFFTSRDPIEAAQYSCDKHVVKMSLETAQMLCTVAVENGHKDPCLYKPVHQKHPCTLWAGENVANWAWLCRHGIALCQEYTFRYDKRHKCEDVIRTIYRDRLGPQGIVWLTGMTPLPQAMPDKYKNPDPVKAYRAYYIGEKNGFARWSRRNPPTWWLLSANT